MKKEFEMKNLGLMNYFIGIEVEQLEQGIFIYQKKYSTDILKRFRMDKCKPVDTLATTGTKLSKQDEGEVVNSTMYMRLGGSLMYLTATRTNIMYAVILISKFMVSPKYSHWKVGKKILRYIIGTMDYGIWYSGFEDNSLVG